MTDLKNSPYWTICGQCWQMLKASLPARNDQSYWDEVITRGESITRAYIGTPFYDFAVSQASSVIDELDRLAKAGKLESFQKPDEKPLQTRKPRYTPTCPTQKGR